MDLADAVARRQMTRNFDPRPVPQALLDAILEGALRAPSAGNARGTELLVLTEADRRELFWEVAADESWRSTAPQAPGISAAPVIVLPLVDPAVYVERYGRPDKAGSRLGGRAASEWPVPYWLVDSAFSVMSALLLATGSGIGALFFQLHGEPEVIRHRLEVPSHLLMIGGLALGYPASGSAAKPSKLAERDDAERIHRERW